MQKRCKGIKKQLDTIPDKKNYKVMDPCCGDGMFLIKAHNFFTLDIKEEKTSGRTGKWKY